MNAIFPLLLLLGAFMIVKRSTGMVRKNNLRTSNNGFNIIKEAEGLRLKPYQDVAGFWTIGYGHKIIEGDPFYPEGDIKQITNAQAFGLLASDVGKAERAVNNLVKVPLTQNQFDALVSFVFNLGTGNFKKSTLLKKLNESDYEGAAEQLPRWRFAGGREWEGLINRRNKEKALFLA